jgi:alcohol dehydrogenase (NADP+)
MLPDQGEMSPHAPDGTPLIDKSVSLNETWAAMEDLLATGKVKTIGICNMIQSEVEQILKTAKHKPDIMQMEVGRLSLLLPLQHFLQALTPPPLLFAKIHPYLQQGPYVKWLQAQGIVVTAYSPFGNLNPTFAVKDEGKIINHPVILDIAESMSSPIFDGQQGRLLNTLSPPHMCCTLEYGKTPAQVVLSWGVNHDLSVIPKSTNPKRLEENLGVFNIEPADLAKLDGIDKNIRYNDASEDFGYSFFSSEKSADVVKKQMLKGL